MIGLYWGRFNPPHKGHLELIKKLLTEADKLIIAIGSAEFKNTRRNPFDGKERKQMMEAYLKEEGIDTNRIKVIPVPDGRSFSSAVNNLFELCGKFDAIYTDKEAIIRLIKSKSRIKRIKRAGTISSTKIRNAIANDKEWEHLTGKSVAKLIKRFRGIERIKRAYKNC